MNIQKNKTRAIIGTLMFHLMLLICFIFFGFNTPLPLPDEEGVEVNLGSSDHGTGEIEPINAISDNAPNKSSNAIINYITQNNEESVALNKNENKTGKTNREEFKVYESALYNGNKNKNGSSQGISDKYGNQGNPNGNPNSDNYTGNSPSGNGNPAFNLSGRGYKSLSLPKYNLKDEGIVVVNIWVDKMGKVTKAIAGGRGTTTTTQILWKLAEDAAYLSKFEIKHDAPEEQKGTITYNFINLN